MRNMTWAKDFYDKVPSPLWPTRLMQLFSIPGTNLYDDI